MKTSLATAAGMARLGQRPGPLFRFLASLKLAVILLVVLATVLAVATILDARHGMAYAHWYVYDSYWFSGLLFLLGVNIFSAAAIRFPWKRHQTGFVITHAGLLVLLAGSIQSFLGGLEGQVALVEGETTSSLTIPQRSQITAVWADRPGEAPYEFVFEGGPVAWREGKTLDVGEVDGVGARILRYYRHAQPVEDWIADDSQTGGPLVSFKLTGPNGTKVAGGSLVDIQFGDALLVGPIRLQLQRATSDKLLDEFLNPPTGDLGKAGLLVMAFQDAVVRVPVDGSVGKPITLDDTGAVVEITEYLPNAYPDKLGQFVSRGEHPKNPMVELRVRLPGAAQPLRQIAFAKDPLLNLDGVYDTVCPVKFRYHHPAMTPPTTVEFLRSRDGKLHGRVFAGGEYTQHGTLSRGDRIAVPGNFHVSLAEYLPHAKQKVTFQAARSTAVQKNKDELQPAALVEMRVGGAAHKVWLQRNDPRHGLSTIVTPQGRLLLRFGYGKVPLDFSLKLLDFRREENPGRVGNAAFSSQVQLLDEERRLDREHVISMNEPLTHRRLTFYQSGFNEEGHGKEASVFSVAYDPGRTLKYSGSLMICLGIAVMFYMKAYFFKSKPRGAVAQAAAEDAPPAATETPAGSSAVPPPLGKARGFHAGTREKQEL